MELKPRHYRVIEFLEQSPKKKYDISTIAKACNLSMPVLRNEITHLCTAGYIKRKPYGRTFEYYAAREVYKPVSLEKAKPLTLLEYAQLFNTTVDPNYEPRLNKLGWNLPKSLVELAAVGLGYEGSQATCRKALAALHEAAQTYIDILGRILATPELWDGRLSQWLTEGQSEENLEKLAELTRQGLAAHGKLAEQEQDTTKE